MEYITGSTGFLGTHLTPHLKDVAPISHERIDNFKLGNFTNFFFLSAYGNMSYHNDDKATLKANVIDLITLLEQAIDKNFNSFVFISTSMVKLDTQNLYSRTKKAAEEILLAFMEKYHKPICIVRPFSITGVGEQKEHLIPTLIRSCLEGEEIKFVPNPTHDFTDVDDVVSGILNLAEHRAKGVFELGTGIKTSNAEVLRIVERVTGKKANIKEVSSIYSYDNPNWVSTNFKARMWGWLPQKTLEQSVTEMVEAYGRSK